MLDRIMHLVTGHILRCISEPPLKKNTGVTGTDVLPLNSPLSAEWLEVRRDWFEVRYEWLEVRCDWLELRCDWLEVRCEWLEVRCDWLVCCERPFPKIINTLSCKACFQSSTRRRASQYRLATKKVLLFIWLSYIHTWSQT